MANVDFEQHIHGYNLDYCYFLEAVYGKNMLSEGGAEAIEVMFQGISSLEQKAALDIGCGLGGVGIYLAEKFDMAVTGIDINPAMIAEANGRIPASLKKQIHFQVYKDISALPFPAQYFDIVYSKGVLTHVKDKAILFGEIARILKPAGKFIINDWLSPVDKNWDISILKMCEMENLTLYAVCAESYRQYLTHAGFKILDGRDDTHLYASYNQALVSWLKAPANHKAFKIKFGDKAWQDAYQGYQLIADAMKSRALLVKNFVCLKPSSAPTGHLLPRG